MERFDMILVGGGLQSGLLVLALREMQPSATIALVESSPRLGGNHTWCFHASDLSPRMADLCAPLVVADWPAHDVRFPAFERRLTGRYSAVSGERLHAVVSTALDARDRDALFLGCPARSLDPRRVELEDGRVLEAGLVIDARGPTGSAGTGRGGYQVFFGQELELNTPHRWDVPLLMDASIDQSAGYRFMYGLPLGERRILLEDTSFSQGPRLDREAGRRAISEYASARGLSVRAVIREEEGVLPMPWRGSLPDPQEGTVLRAGYRGGWFHPGTGYSFPVAARLAEAVAVAAGSHELWASLRELAAAHRSQARYCHLLNRLLFRWYPPNRRRHIFERFYRFPQETIERFYALRLRGRDRMRLLVGRPPRGLSLRHRLRAEVPA